MNSASENYFIKTETGIARFMTAKQIIYDTTLTIVLTLITIEATGKIEVWKIYDNYATIENIF